MTSATAVVLLGLRGLRSVHGGPFDLDIGRGECVSLMGPSGSGKSLLMRLIADLDPGTGTVCLHGRQRNAWSAPEWRRQVVYQAAEPAWWAPTVAAHFASDKVDAARAMLGELGLPEAILDAEVARLSTGERQRLALLRSLSLQPAVLLLDEPTAALDAASTTAVENLLRRRLQDGLSILWVTHSREQAVRMGTRHYEMHDGQARLS